MCDTWYLFDAGYATVYISAVSLADAREYARAWHCGRYIRRGEPDKNAHHFGVTEARREEIKREKREG